jgi:geranylgeranyl diphosphate synthase, type I
MKAGEEMKEYFTAKKEEISRFLDHFASENSSDYGKISFLGEDALLRLVDFSKQGKMLRGGMVSLAYELFGKTAGKNCAALGAALELFQSALLIHDDIMDRDTVRRGCPSVYHQYVLESGKWGLHEPDHTGEALGICAGDIAFFTAFEMIGAADLPNTVKSEIFRLSSRELSYVGIAQMLDVYYGADRKVPDPDEVLHLYIYKTGRYTFSLPLMIGGIAAEQGPAVISVLEDIGVALGTIFQLKDDELGIFGDEEKLGKPLGSDVREGKKTLLYIFLFQQAGSAERKKLSSIFGNQHASAGDVAYVRDLMSSYGLRKKVEEVASGFVGRAREGVKKLSGADGRAAKVLEELIEYSISRVR